MTDATQGHNAASRKQMLKEFCTSLDEIDEEMAGLRDRAKEIKKRVKSELDMTLAHFNFMRRLATKEPQEREGMFDVIREGFDALSLPWPG